MERKYLDHLDELSPRELEDIRKEAERKHQQKLHERSVERQQAKLRRPKKLEQK